MLAVAAGEDLGARSGGRGKDPVVVGIAAHRFDGIGHLRGFGVARLLRFAGPGNPWTVNHHRWLRRLVFDDRAAEVTFADYLAAVEALSQRRSALEATLEELAPESPWAVTIARLRCFRGLDTLSAVGLCAEIGEFERFGHPRRLGAFLGLVPSERTSDEKRHQGAITKAGPKHSRRLLVEAAEHAWRRPRISDELRARRARSRVPLPRGRATLMLCPRDESTAEVPESERA